MYCSLLSMKQVFASVLMRSNINQTKVLHIEHSETLQVARQCIQRGQVIALPTDTVYGLACDANNIEAVRKLYDIKGRDDHKPIAICVQNLAALRRYGHAEHLSDALLQQLLPGPITIVIESTPQLNNALLNPKTSRIGIRIPNLKFIRALCNLYKEQPLALTSANRSGEPSSLQVQEFAGLWPQLGLVCDAGQLSLSEEQRCASTVIDLAIPGYYHVLREGIAAKSTRDILDKFNVKPMNI